MKLLVAFLALCAFASSYPQQQISDKGLLQKQKDVLRLFRYVNQPSYYKDFNEIAQNFDLEQNYNNYANPEVPKYYYQIYQYGLLPRGQVFSVFYQEHLQQAIALYKLFYYAKDYQTFYNTAVWARQYINEGVYLYSLSVAIVHRNDTYGVVLPPIYETYPYYFYNNEVIQQAQRYKQQYDGKSYTINANYSGYYLNLNPEQSLSYFTEDVGINSFYYYYNVYYPFWLGGQDFNYQNDLRGELFYYVYQQILARYYLERLSNGFGEIPYFNYEVPFENGYYPSLQYPNGLFFPQRPNFANLYEYFYNYGQKYGTNKYAYSYTFVQDYERRIREAIDQGYVYTPEGQKINLYTEQGLNILGNLIESNPDSPNYRYYGALQVYGRHLLGYSYQPLNQYQVAPSALEHFETSLRDPAFYQFYKRVLLYFQQYQNNLPAYTAQDLSYQGVEVTNVQFDRLVTYFDYFYTDLSNAVYVTPEEFNGERVQIRARQYRLNHKAFTYKIYVKSSQAQKASVRVYLGPKYDEYGRYLNISQNRLNFVQFDHFVYQLQAGENTIERNSRQSYFYQNDRTSYQELYQKVLGALDGNGQFSVEPNEAYFGFPRRFLLPKGNYGGYEYQFYVIVSPYVPYQGQQTDSKYYYPRVGSGAQYLDNYPLGYPFDRPVHYDQVYNNIPNSFVYSAKIYHRDVEDINASSASSQ
ncbi:hexamerin 3 precursor [Tribolium castaneum]|uniref:Larval serum protein 2-like Protein n=1 Tax=Tribolium castaneum TaxID=7070 RepID=D6WUR1_TRICA|nr:hexamerin 3 precursor [Tribolium castaneum]EFA09144.1 Larval serum protein 2-like Protein [Tribolium castaneum]|eukprot:NP_001164202.1 hexamerin 3 precursor [Tribolium castaneum]